MDKSRFGPFALEDKLGEDPSGSVFRALHLQQRKLVALKLFSAPLVSNSPSAKAALVHEVETLKKLQHPNIARCYGGLLEESQGCIISELVEGETLAAVLSRRGRFSWESVVEYALQISSALEYAHAAGVIHQDLTPEKILVSENGQVKIVDFRCDRMGNPTCTTSQRQTPQRAKYLSPEQFAADTPITHKADLYMLGCVMFEMLVGHLPFDGTTVQELAVQHKEMKPPRVDALVLDCPVWLDSLIGQLLDKDPTRRPYSAEAVTAALTETHKKMADKTSVLEHAAGGFSALQRTDQTVARDLLRKARRQADEKERSENEPSPVWERPWFLAICLVVLLASVSAWLFWPRSEDWYFAQAQALMDTDDKLNWQRARDDYLNPMLEKFPDGAHVEAGQGYIDQADMAQAESAMMRRSKIGREPKSEGERLFAEALQYEQFGDRISALEQYESMIDLFPDKGPDRPYVNLAKRQKALIEKSGETTDRKKFIEKQLDRADELVAKGDIIEARKIWQGIVTLYAAKREYAALVEQAQDRIDSRGKSASESKASSSKDSGGEQTKEKD